MKQTQDNCQTAALTKPFEQQSEPLKSPKRLIGAELHGLGSLFYVPDDWRPVRPEQLPHHHMVPRNRAANLRFRKELMEMAKADEEVAQGLRQMCTEDPIFWLSAFVWTYNPNTPDYSVMPFIPYPYEEDLLMILICATGAFGCHPRDVVIEKSRDMGATWTSLAALLWRAQFNEFVDFLVVSRNEDYVDKTEDKKSLFWKLDFMIEMQPSFIRPRIERTKKHIRAIETESTIEGEATTGDIARGDRRTAIMVDEFAAILDGDATRASTADASQCRIFISTHKATRNAFRDLCEDENFMKCRVHWTLHPEKGRDAWYDDEQERWRSPWYDKESKRRTRAEIAAEVDMEPIEAGDIFFPRSLLVRVKREQCRPPTVTGVLEWPGDLPLPGRVKFKPQGGGYLKLWLPYDRSKPAHEQMIGPSPFSDYVVGADIGLGVNASNSVAVGIDQINGEKIAELITDDKFPHEFSVLAVALCYFLSGSYGPALLNWETNGPGQIFGKTIERLRYRRVWYKKEGAKLAKTPGFSSSGQQKLILLGELRRALENGDYTERSEFTIMEAQEYIHKGDTVVTTADARDSSTTQKHGDTVIATAVAWIATRQGERNQTKKQVPLLCMGRRIEERRQEEKKKLAMGW